LMLFAVVFLNWLGECFSDYALLLIILHSFYKGHYTTGQFTELNSQMWFFA
jgi:hypothetical protein